MDQPKTASSGPAATGKQAFGSLSAEEQELVRAAQRAAKAKKKLAKGDAKSQEAGVQAAKEEHVGKVVEDLTDEEAVKAAKRKEIEARVAAARKQMDAAAAAKKDFPTRITQEEYFDACPRRMFYDRQMTANEDVVETIMNLVDSNAPIGSDPRGGGDVCLSEFQYFIFAGSQKQIWDPTFYARLAWEGFFTITTDHGPHGGTEPLPELQPFYGVVDWDNFNNCKHVRKTLKKLRHWAAGHANEMVDESAPAGAKQEPTEPDCDYHMYANADLDGTYKKLDAHQKKTHGCNWLTPKYFDVMKQANADARINFKLYSIELYDGALGATSTPAPAKKGLFGFRSSQSSAPQKPRLIAGEIGFSIGKVYTSLSGFYDVTGCGTVQLVFLGRWLEHKKYSFWSMGHCYSPHMEYKRQLGHRVYPRKDFLQKVRQHRGSFRSPTQDSAGAASGFVPIADGEECDLQAVLAENASSANLISM